MSFLLFFCFSSESKSEFKPLLSSQPESGSKSVKTYLNISSSLCLQSFYESESESVSLIVGTIHEDIF